MLVSSLSRGVGLSDVVPLRNHQVASFISQSHPTCLLVTPLNTIVTPDQSILRDRDSELPNVDKVKASFIDGKWPMGEDIVVVPGQKKEEYIMISGFRTMEVYLELKTTEEDLAPSLEQEVVCKLFKTEFPPEGGFCASNAKQMLYVYLQFRRIQAATQFRTLSDDMTLIRSVRKYLKDQPKKGPKERSEPGMKKVVDELLKGEGFRIEGPAAAQTIELKERRKFWNSRVMCSHIKQRPLEMISHLESTSVRCVVLL